MNNLDDLYNIYIQSLFIMPFDEIIKKYDNSYYSWDKFEKIFLQMYNLLNESKNEKELLNNYYIFTFIYLNYTSYLKYSSNPDFNNPDIYKIVNKIKYNKNIVAKILKYNSNSNIQKIIKMINPFINIQLKSHKLNNSEYFNKLLDEYLINSKQMEKLSEMSNENSHLFRKTFSNI